MTAITREFRLYTNAGLSIPPVIHVNQYDQGETWNFKLYQPNGQQFIPTDAAIVGVKADGNLIANAGTVSDGVVVITETEQMTAAPGKAVFEILFDGDTHGTANFVVMVEASPTNDGVASESDLSLFQEAIDSTSPAAIAQGVSDWMSEHLTPTTPVVDDTLTVQGAAADSKKVGDEISDLRSAIAQGGGFTAEVKAALDNLVNHIGAWTDRNARQYIDALHSAMYPPANLVSISAVYTQSGTVYDTDSLDSLKADLVVTAHYDNYSTEIVTTYTLSGTLTAGTSTITVSYGGKTDTFTVAVTSSVPDPYYVLAGTPKTFASVNDAVDTGVLINTWAEYDYTIVGEFTGTDHGSGQKHVFSSVASSSPWFGLGLIQVGDSMRVFAGNGDVNTSVSTANETPIRFVIRHEADATVISADFYADNNRYSYSVNTKNNVTNDVTLKIGRHLTGSPFIGTISDFKIYKDFFFTESLVTNYLGG